MNKKITLDKEKINKIIYELKEVEIFLTDEMLKKRLGNIIKSMENLDENYSEQSISYLIYEKMKESKSKNPELNTRLYILYRDIQNGRISEEKASELYKEYLQLYPDDIIIY